MARRQEVPHLPWKAHTAPRLPFQKHLFQRHLRSLGTGRGRGSPLDLFAKHAAATTAISASYKCPTLPRSPFHFPCGSDHSFYFSCLTFASAMASAWIPPLFAGLCPSHLHGSMLTSNTFSSGAHSSLLAHRPLPYTSCVWMCVSALCVSVADLACCIIVMGAGRM